MDLVFDIGDENDFIDMPSPSQSSISEDNEQVNQTINNTFIRELDKNQDGLKIQEEQEDEEDDALTFNDMEEQNEVEEEDEQVNVAKIDLPIQADPNFKPHDYQLELFKKSIGKNSIIFLETGKGKTLIALMHVYYYIKKNGYEKTKLVFLANTIQLVEQQCKYFRENIYKVALYMENNGLAPTDNQFDLENFNSKEFKRKFIIPVHSKSISNDEEIDVQGWKRERWDEVISESCVLIMMGQMLLNGLRRGYLQLPYFSLIIFDECHHAKLNHSYRMIISEFYEDERVRKEIPHSDKIKFLGLTATPVTSIDIEKAAKVQKVDSQQIELDLLLLAKGMHSTFCMVETKKDQNEVQTIYKTLPYDKEFGVSCYFIPNQEALTQFYTQWQQIYFTKQKEKISYGIQLLVDQLYHYVTMYGLILYKELGTYSFYQFIKRLEQDFKSIKTVHKTEKDQRLLEDIQKLFYNYLALLKQFDVDSDENCSNKYLMLREELNNIIKQQQDDENKQHQYKILIFVDQKITSLYLHQLLEKQKIQNAYVVGTGNQTSGALQMTILKEKNKAVSLNPNQNVLAIAEQIYNQFRIEGQEQEIELDNEKNEDDETAKIKLRSQLQEVLEGIKNYGKNLDQTITSSKEQQESISQFKDKINVLVSTNVTEEGFDVPACNYVFVYGEISTLKQYVQKIGRARAKNSVVFFVLPQDKVDSQVIKNTILEKSIKSVELRIQEINQDINDKNQYRNIDQKIKQLRIRLGQLQTIQPYYDSRLVKESKALLTTNWAVEILSNYANLFKNYEYREKDENFIRGIFYQYTQFPALGFKCVLILPRNSSERYFVGDLEKNKDNAKKSAAFKAVIALRRKGLLTEDLRPIKGVYSFAADKKNDPNMKDPSYYKVIEESVILKTEPQQDLRQKMFPYLMDVFEIDIGLPLHLYRFKFYDLPNPINPQLENQYNIGFVHNDKFCDRLAFSGGKEIRLEYVKQIKLSEQDYQLLFQVHSFILATSFDLDIQFYQFLTSERIDSESALYQQKKTEQISSIDLTKCFALLVFLTKNDDEEFDVDFVHSEKILNYQTKMKKVFSFLNSIRQKKKKNLKIKEERIRLANESLRYESWTTLEYDGELIKKMKDQNFKGIVAQNISDRFHLSKVVLDSKKDVNEILQNCLQQEKKLVLEQEYQQMRKVLKSIVQFNFDQETDVYAAPILRKFLKNFIAENRETIIQKKSKQPKYVYFAGEFYQFPIDLLTCLELRILIKHIMLQLRDLLISFSFKKRNAKLLSSPQDLKHQVPLYNTMNSLIVEDSLSLVDFFQDNIIEFNDFVERLKNNLQIKAPSIVQVQEFPFNFNKKFSIDEIDNELLNKCFQSQQYNQDDSTNYQVLEFLGDANLKLLASMEVFILFPLANENLLHLERAKIVSNENLRKYAIIFKFFQFIKCTKFPYFPAEFIQKEKESEQDEFGVEAEGNKQKNCVYLKNGEELKNVPKNYQPIPEKVHSDVVEALNGAFLLHYKDVNACQFFLHRIGVLKHSTTEIQVVQSKTCFSKGLIAENLKVLQSIIGYQFKDQSLLVQAITHQSFLEQLDFYSYKKNKCDIIQYQNKQSKLKFNNIKASQLDQSMLNQLNEQGSRFDMSYERLEFLGDSILDQVVVEWLVQEYTKDKVEDLALKKQCVVCNKALALVTLHYKLDYFLFHPNIHIHNHDQYITLNKIKNKYQEYYDDISLMYTQEPIIKILGDIFESLMGAIFVDSVFNYDLTKSVIIKLLKPFMIHFTSPNQILKNPQDRLFRYFKSKNCQNFEFALTDEEPIDGQNLYVLRDKNTLKVYQRIRASTEKHAREKVLEYISRKGALE